MQSLKLKDGSSFPQLGLGTWLSDKGKVYTAVRHAIEVGYRHIDAAAIYGNENEVGEAIRDAIAAGDVTREDIFVTSKLWNDSHRPSDVPKAMESTLTRLGLEYLDLYLIHWAVAFAPGVGMAKKRDEFLTLDEVPIESTWEAMSKLVDQQRTRHIGVSNMGTQRITRLSEVGPTPSVLQVESHPYLPQTDLLQFCNSKNIAYTAYSPLGSKGRPNRDQDEPTLLEDTLVKTIAEAHEATPAQVILAWGIQRGTAVIPKSTNKGRIEENFGATSLTLTDQEMDQLTNHPTSFRYVSGEFFTGQNSPYKLEDIYL